MQQTLKIGDEQILEIHHTPRLSDLISFMDVISSKIQREKELLFISPNISMKLRADKAEKNLKSNEVAFNALQALQKNSIDAIKSSDLAISQINKTLLQIGKDTKNNHRAVEELKKIIGKNKANLRASSVAMSALNRMAYDDELTGLPNRRLLNDRLKKMVCSNKRWDSYSAAIFLDLDKFKSLNDNYGHDAGDEVLKAVSIRLKMTVRETDTVSRYGGDEFVILLDKLSGNLPDSLKEAELVAQKVLGSFDAPFNLNLKNSEDQNALTEYRICASLGISMFGGDSNQTNKILDHADAAMYSAKSLGGGIYKFYDAEDSPEYKLLALYNLANNNDIETIEHGLRVRQYVKLIAKRAHDLNLFPNELNDRIIDRLFKTTQLHDIGKTKIPSIILHKKGRLSLAEWEVLKTHPSLGIQILEQSKKDNPGFSNLLNTAIELAGSHHENWDGSGYPKGLSGNLIPLSGRIMAIADVYDALVSKRDYKKVFTHEKAIDEIVANSGKKFDPLLIDVLIDQQENFKHISELIKSGV